MMHEIETLNVIEYKLQKPCCYFNDYEVAIIKELIEKEKDNLPKKYEE